MTKDEAIALMRTGWWHGRAAREVALFQLTEDKLCMPFGDFHKAVEEACGRPVWTHEFGLNRDGLIAEVKGEREAPSFADILALLPADKTIIVMTAEAKDGQ